MMKKFTIGFVATVLFLVSFASMGAPGTSSKEKDSKSATPTLSNLARSYDKMKGIAWYQSKQAPKHRNANGIFVYFGKNDNGTVTPLRFVAQYKADSWLFISRAWAKVDTEKLDLPQSTSGRSYDKWERDNGYGGIWEWTDVAITSSADISVIRKLATGKDVTIRFEGSKYYDDKTLSSAQKKALLEVITVYEAETKAPWK